MENKSLWAKNLIVWVLSMGFLIAGWLLSDALLVGSDEYLFGVFVGTIIATFNYAFYK